MTVKLYDLLDHIAEPQALHIESNNGMPEGHNGLYHDPETPVRNTSHWLVTFARLYQHTCDERYKIAAKQCASYLQSDNARPLGATFHHRESEGKDKCNGLIGQAWTIEALAVAARVLEMPELAELAEKVFLYHPQDDRTGLWKRVEVNGQTLPFDATFNHQIWFAAAGALLADLPWTSPMVDKRVQTHLDELEANLRLYSSGLIFHTLKPTNSIRRYIHLVRADERGRIGITFLTSSVPLQDRQRKLRWKAIGYHAFNLYAFGLLKQQYPDHDFWKTEKCDRSVQYITKKEYQNSVWENEYGAPYNPIGFEVPFAMEVFDVGTVALQREWITKQLQQHYDSDTKRMDKNTKDPETLTARVYQATRLPNMALPEFENA